MAEIFFNNGVRLIDHWKSAKVTSRHRMCEISIECSCIVSTDLFSFLKLKTFVYYFVLNVQSFIISKCGSYDPLHIHIYTFFTGKKNKWSRPFRTGTSCIEGKRSLNKTYDKRCTDGITFIYTCDPWQLVIKSEEIPVQAKVVGVGAGEMWFLCTICEKVVPEVCQSISNPAELRSGSILLFWSKRTFPWDALCVARFSNSLTSTFCNMSSWDILAPAVTNSISWVICSILPGEPLIWGNTPYWKFPGFIALPLSWEILVMLAVLGTLVVLVAVETLVILLFRDTFLGMSCDICTLPLLWNIFQILEKLNA